MVLCKCNGEAHEGAQTHTDLTQRRCSRGIGQAVAVQSVQICILTGNRHQRRVSHLSWKRGWEHGKAATLMPLLSGNANRSARIAAAVSAPGACTVKEP